MSRFNQTIKTWLPIAITGTALVLLTYVGLQQNYRETANDPQIQMAEDAANLLAHGTAPSEVVSSQKVAVNDSLSPFMIVTDTKGTVLASSATLNGTTPLPPLSTLTDRKSNILFPGKTAANENRFTWEPEKGTRIAAIIVPYTGTNSGYVIAGRNLREIERREGILVAMAGLTEVGLLALSFLVIFLITKPIVKDSLA